MRIAVVGAHGQVARLLVRALGGAGHEVLGVVRNPDHADDVGADGARAVVADLERTDVDALATDVEGCDAVVFAAGSGGGDPERTEAVDRDGAVLLADAAQAAGVPRYVMVSSMGTEATRDGAKPEGLPEALVPYLRAKLAAEDDLRAREGLAWTILRPGGLTDDAGSGRVALAPASEGLAMGRVPRADVAAVLAALVVAPAADGLVLELTGGEEDLADAVARLAG